MKNSSSQPVGVGIIGCGDVSGRYIRNISQINNLQIISVSDKDLNKARRVASEFNLNVVPIEDMFVDQEIEIVLNLTPPSVHAKINLMAVKYGKHIYSEKPLAVSREEAQEILELAKTKNILVGSAPDNFLGPTLQLVRQLIDRGAIGKPLAASAFLATRGPELFHPTPQIYYQSGAGPLFDLGPYCLTAFCALFGPVAKVAATTKVLMRDRVVIRKGTDKGSTFRSQVPTIINSFITFHSGVIADMTLSFDVWASRKPLFEIYGEEGSISIPGPSKFCSELFLRRANEEDWESVPLPDFPICGRGIGIADMAYALRYGSDHKTNGKMAFHVLDIMHTILESSQQQRFLEISSCCVRPDPLDISIFSKESNSLGGTPYQNS